jgi:hypothetical protein
MEAGLTTFQGAATDLPIGTLAVGRRTGHSACVPSAGLRIEEGEALLTALDGVER